MKTDMIQAYNPEFTARCNFRGDIDSLSIDQLREILIQCRKIGTMRDQIDIFIPNKKTHPGGIIPMAGYVDGEIRAFIGKYSHGKVYEGIIEAVKFAQKTLFPKHFHKEPISLKYPNKQPYNHKKHSEHNKTDVIPRLKHINHKEFDFEISGHHKKF